MYIYIYIDPIYIYNYIHTHTQLCCVIDVFLFKKSQGTKKITDRPWRHDTLARSHCNAFFGPVKGGVELHEA